MRRKLHIPDEVRESILGHLKTAIDKAIGAYENACEEEDALTGQLGISLKSPSVSVPVKGDQRREIRPGVWRWKLDYYKFRGRGPKSTENYLGADGIFQYGIDYGDGFQKKSILFQSKNDLDTDKELFIQSLKLSTWREAAFVINFTPEAVEAFSLDEVVKSKGSRKGITESTPLYEFLNDKFLECQVGDFNLDYDPRSHRLTWLSHENKKVTTKFAVKDRLSLKITPPKYKDNFTGTEISNSEIYNHRMMVDHDDMLGLDYNFTNKELQKARNRFALAYHSDINNDLDELAKQIQKRRMQELNHAYAELKRKIAKK